MNASLLAAEPRPHTAATFEITPGRLVKLGETLAIQTNHAGHLRICHGLAKNFAEITSVDLSPSESWEFTPTTPGMYLAELEIDGQWLRRPFAVVDKGWAVCLITVGAFTAQDFAGTIHKAGINADYYVGPEKNKGSKDFTFHDPRWLRYERKFGDSILPHVMANSLGEIDPRLAFEDANWDEMPMAGILERLEFLQKWWEKQGHAPLTRIASYTPCNRFIEALKKRGIRILHSVVPEQNWSDGEWAINHWGMPTCPFWVAPDDFRKAGPRTKDGVLAITMNHYHVLIPHLTMWGDFVLSPSHFTRWLRAADSGDESTRYLQFLKDTLRSWTSLSDDPFFFVAGYEFGRTFGTANMTDYNQRGLEALIEQSKTQQLVFATGDDVVAYFDRHQPGHPETAFRQRDYWVGVTVNNKPGQAGDSIVLERRDYKALIRENELLPFFHYDYLVAWKFATRDMNAPRDFSQEDQTQLVAHREKNFLHLKAQAPLARTIPVAIWDAEISHCPFALIQLPELEDQRRVSVIEIPAGWSGSLDLQLTATPASVTRRNDIWKMQTFDQGPQRHTYLHLDAPLTQPFTAQIELKKRTRVDSATGTLGLQGPGILQLEFGLLQGWYRFWQCGLDDIVPDESIVAKLKQSNVILNDNWLTDLERHETALQRRVEQQLLPEERIAYQLFCGAKLPLGTRSRAGDFDHVTIAHPTLHGHEKADGVIAFAPGKSFWYHPRNLPFRIDGFPKGTGERRWKLILHSFDPQALDAHYQVVVGNRECGLWKLPTTAESEDAFFSVNLTPADINSKGQLCVLIKTQQTQLLHWWKDRGFIAAIHALWMIES